MVKNFILLCSLALFFSGCQQRLNTPKVQVEFTNSFQITDDSFISKVAVLQSMVKKEPLPERRYASSLLRPNYLQKELYRGLAKKVSKGELDLKLQSFLESNAKIDRHRLHYSSLSQADKVYVGNMLSVDAVIVCEFYDGVNESDWIESSEEIDRINEIVFYISMYDARNGGLIWREKTRTSPKNEFNNLERLAIQSIDLLLKELPNRLEHAPGIEEISLL